MITFENLNGGVGMRALYGVLRDGKHVATIRRYTARDGWLIDSVHYGVRLGAGKDIETAKQKAREIAYPSKLNIYEMLCTKKLDVRREYAERRDGPKLAALVRSMIAGSNSARDEIDALVAEWDRFAADRTDTQSAAMARVEAYNATIDRYSGNWRYADSPSSYPYYPEPPESTYA